MAARKADEKKWLSIRNVKKEDVRRYIYREKRVAPQEKLQSRLPVKKKAVKQTTLSHSWQNTSPGGRVPATDISKGVRRKLSNKENIGALAINNKAVSRSIPIKDSTWAENARLATNKLKMEEEKKYPLLNKELHRHKQADHFSLPGSNIGPRLHTRTTSPITIEERPETTCDSALDKDVDQVQYHREDSPSLFSDTSGQDGSHLCSISPQRNLSVIWDSVIDGSPELSESRIQSYLECDTEALLKEM